MCIGGFIRRGDQFCITLTFFEIFISMCTLKCVDNVLNGVFLCVKIHFPYLFSLFWPTQVDRMLTVALKMYRAEECRPSAYNACRQSYRVLTSFPRIWQR